jgi:hypothetical protein
LICYLCSYPRSGNSLLQSILIENFRRLVSRIQGHFDTAPGLRDPEWEVQDAPEPLAGWPDGLVWNDQMVVYRRREGATWRRMLKPGPEHALAPELREALAAESDLFIFKTHGGPFERYFEGERVVQIVRHPGPTLWSEFRYLNDGVPITPDQLFVRPPPTLETVIEGDPESGSWATYMQRWLAAADELGERYLQLKYHEVAPDPSIGVNAISRFLGIQDETGGVVSFENYRRRWPGWDLRGVNDGYERFFSARQLDLLWERHGAVAESLGFAPPDPSHCLPDEQIRRLGDLIKAAWARGYEVELEHWRARKRLRNALEPPVTPSDG